MEGKNERVTQKLIKTRNIVKRKLRNLKLGTLQKETELEKSYKPIIKSLKDIASNISTVNVKHEIKEEEEPEMDEREEKEQQQHSSKRWAAPQFLDTRVVAEADAAEDDEVFAEPELDEIPTSLSRTDISRPSLSRGDIEQLMRHPSFVEYLEQYDPLPRYYIEEMLNDDKDSFDFKYGVRHDPDTDKFYIGDSEIKIVGKDIVINNLTYPGTTGLYELLFKKEPTGYTKDDHNNYIDIVKQTNAHRRNYAASEQISGSKMRKYTQVIGPKLDPQLKKISSSRKISSKSVIGKSYLKTFNKKRAVEYVYWDNINELVDRLRLLIASRDAGHSNHQNEIISIIEELKEANVIE